MVQLYNEQMVSATSRGTPRATNVVASSWTLIRIGQSRPCSFDPARCSLARSKTVRNGYTNGFYIGAPDSYSGCSQTR